MLGSLFNRLAGLKVCNFLKNRLQHRCFLFLRIFLLCNNSGGCFWQSYHGTVKSAGVPVLWFRASTCFQFWSKTFTKRCTNNSLLSRDKSFLLSWIDWSRAFDFRICFGKTLIASDFDEKLTKRCRSNYVISRVKSLSSPVLCVGQVLSISGYDLENEKMPCKQK